VNPQYNPKAVRVEASKQRIQAHAEGVVIKAPEGKVREGEEKLEVRDFDEERVLGDLMDQQKNKFEVEDYVPRNEILEQGTVEIDERHYNMVL